MLAGFLKALYYFAFETRVYYNGDIGVGKLLFYTAKEAADGGQNEVQAVLCPIRKLELTDRRLAPAVVCAAEDKELIDSVFFEKALFCQLVEAVYEGRGLGAVGVVVSCITDRRA